MPSVRLLSVAFFAVLAMSAVPVLIKSTEANEVTIGIARLAIAVTAFLPVFVVSSRKGQKLYRADWLRLLAIGIAFGIHWITYFISIKQATAAIAAMSMATYGIQYLVLARVFNNERFTWVEWGAVCLCLGGCVVMAPAISLDNQVTKGILIGMLSGLSYACLPLLHQRCRHIGVSTRTLGQFLFALLIFLPLLPRANWDLAASDYLKLFVLGMLCTVIGHGLWVKSSTELPAIYTSMMYYLYVPIALVSSALFLQEPMTAEKIMGALMILTASVGVTFLRYRRMVSREPLNKCK